MKNALTAALAVSLAGCGLLEAEAESKNLCVHQTNMADVVAAPAGSVSLALPFDLVLDMGAAVPDLDEEGVELDIRPSAITLGSASGDVDFSGVEALTLVVQPPTNRADLTPAEFRYQRPTPVPTSVRELAAVPVQPVDLAEYLEGDALRLRASFAGQAPQRDWTATLELCSASKVTVNYWDRITD